MLSSVNYFAYVVCLKSIYFSNKQKEESVSIYLKIRIDRCDHFNQQGSTTHIVASSIKLINNY